MAKQTLSTGILDWQLGPGVDRINSGMMYLNKAMEISVANTLAMDLLATRIPIGEKVPLEQFLSPDREEYQVLASIVTAEKELRDFIITWELDGQVRHILMDSFCHEDEGGRVTGMYFVTKELTNFSTIEQQLQRSDKLATVGKIAAGIAHEIRNPLTTVKGFLQMFQSRMEQRDMVSELQYIEVMLEEINRVNSLVSELLLLAKPHQVEKVPCSVVRLVEELKPVIESEILINGIHYETQLNPVPLVVADAALMKQVILNLVKNAGEAMESGGCLRIMVNATHSHVVLEITDNGPGIPYYQMDKIFDAFFTTKEKGTGLGLPICQRIVADHGGEIRVSSKGFGTTFTVLLPIKQ